MENIFEVKNMIFRYPNAANDTISSVSFNVEKGTIFGLLGPSGAGKSTTQKILTKLISGYSGSIIYKGKDLKSYGKNFYENVGIGFEMPVHFNKLTALENLDFFASLYKNKYDYLSLLTRLGLFDARNQMVGEYSKGMKVRLNFVRALINNPDVIFLDEPTSGLDPNNAKIVKDLIFDLKKEGKTIFITTHLMGDVEQLCDHVVFMNKGVIIETSSVRELKKKYGKKEIKVEYYNNDSLCNKIFPLDNIGQNVDFIDILSKEKIETIHSGETSLENIFIQITGSKHYE